MRAVKLILGGILLITLFSFLQGAREVEDASAPPSTGVKVIPKTDEDPEVLEWSFTKTGDFGMVRMAGDIKNTVGVDIEYLEIKFHLLDEEERVVDSAMDNITNLKVGDTWHFDATAFGDGKVKYARIVELNWSGGNKNYFD